jgi:hypothetical protein
LVNTPASVNRPTIQQASGAHWWPIPSPGGGAIYKEKIEANKEKIEINKEKVFLWSPKTISRSTNCIVEHGGSTNGRAVKLAAGADGALPRQRVCSTLSILIAKLVQVLPG